MDWFYFSRWSCVLDSLLYWKAVIRGVVFSDLLKSVGLVLSDQSRGLACSELEITHGSFFFFGLPIAVCNFLDGKAFLFSFFLSRLVMLAVNLFYNRGFYRKPLVSFSYSAIVCMVCSSRFCNSSLICISLLVLSLNAASSNLSRSISSFSCYNLLPRALLTSFKSSVC